MTRCKIALAELCTDSGIDAHRLYPVPQSHRLVKIGTHRRDVQPKTPGPGTIDEASRASLERSAEAARRGCRDGEQPSLHGHARSAERRCDDNDELYARRYEEAGKDEGGISQSAQAMSWI